MARIAKKTASRWVTFDKDPDIQFLLKPFTILYLKKIPSEEGYTPEFMWNIFDSSVVDWKGINGDDGKPLPCNSDTRRIVAEEFEDLFLFGALEVIKIKNDNKIPEIEVKN